MRNVGSSKSSILILIGEPSAMARVDNIPLSGYEKNFMESLLMKGGIHPSDCYFATMDSLDRPLSDFGVVLGLGEKCLSMIDKKGIDKHQCSVYTVGQLNKTCFIPIYDMKRVNKQYELNMFLQLAIAKAKKILVTGWHPEPIIYHANPPFDDAMDLLKIASNYDHSSIDIETSCRQINTFGVANTTGEGLAIGCLPDRLGAVKYKQLWDQIATLLENDSKKILQNAIYERSYFSVYGIKMKNVYWDTMWAQKFLWPEFKQGLDNVGRMYTDMVYWKEDNKDWNNIKDWSAHYRYNVKDTVGTMRGYLNQLKELIERGQLENYLKLVQTNFALVEEMCLRGLPVNEETHAALKKRVEDESRVLTKEIQDMGGPPNPRSPLQLKTWLKTRGHKLPKKRSTKGTWEESTDIMSLKKMRSKKPTEKAFEPLIKLSSVNKAKSSYLAFDSWSDDRLRYMLNSCGTKSGRWSGSKDIWWGGINPQTFPSRNPSIPVKDMIEAPPGYLLMEIDLSQAESRFVAYDSNDRDLIDLLEDPKRDIHRYVAAEIFKKNQEDIIKSERQLGKKSGHGANYAMQWKTFQDSCLREMDLVLTKKESENVLESYHRLFPGLRRWHQRIRNEVAGTRKLDTPMGRSRNFFGRLGDDLFREAYSFRPQSTIPDVTNALLKGLESERSAGRLSFELLLQVHDSGLFLVRPNDVEAILDYSQEYRLWHPSIDLPGGNLIIPTEVEIARVWGQKKEINHDNMNDIIKELGE